MNSIHSRAVVDRVLRNALPLFRGIDQDDAAALQDLGLDSLKAINVLLALEQEVGCALPDDQIEQSMFASASSLVAFLDRVSPVLLPSQT